MVKHFSVFLFMAGAIMVMNHSLAAQKKSDTINKVIVKNIPISANDDFSVVSEKATVQVTGWTKKYIMAKITFAAIHPDRETATRELEFMQYALTREKNGIELRNTFILPSSIDYIESKLNVLIELMVPDGTSLALNDRYGNVEISRFTGKVTAMIEFSDLNVSSVGGEFKLRSIYSEIRSQDLAVSAFTCEDEKSQIHMDLENGEYTFHSKHSDISLTLTNIKALTVKASRTNVTVMSPNLTQYSYNLVNSDGKIYLPSQYISRIKKSGKQNIFRLNSLPAKPSIEITTTFNTITIK